MVIINEVDRFSLAIYVIDWVAGLQVAGVHAKEELWDMQIDCRNHVHEYGVDRPETADWRWSE